MSDTESISAILNILPQTQCGECGFAGCRPYAEAIISKQAPINLCPPGGLSTLQALAELTVQDAAPLKASLSSRVSQPVLAKIREEECIGCMKCVQACPVDAIFGAPKLMHVVVSDQCTGCQLCVAPCPMDCIDLIPVPQLHYDKSYVRDRYEAKLARGDFKRMGRISENIPRPLQQVVDKKRFITEAVARAKQARHAKSGSHDQ